MSFLFLTKNTEVSRDKELLTHSSTQYPSIKLHLVNQIRYNIRLGNSTRVSSNAFYIFVTKNLAYITNLNLILIEN